MTKANEEQITRVREALAAGKAPDVAVRINFGEAEPIQFLASGAEPVSLSGKTRAQLEQIAAAEGVDISGAGTNAEIAAAIETARAKE